LEFEIFDANIVKVTEELGYAKCNFFLQKWKNSTEKTDLFCTLSPRLVYLAIIERMCFLCPANFLADPNTSFEFRKGHELLEGVAQNLCTGF
jgi:hypothetical protein